MTEVAEEKISTRGTKTRSALLKAGLELFSARPVDAVAINDIVELASVAKGSFFNHFEDKHAFAAALATAIRLDIERMISLANEEISDPVHRLARGMRVAVSYALTERARTLVMLRSQEHVATNCNPLNDGVSADIVAALHLGALRPEAAEWGVLCWLGLCQAVIASTAHKDLSPFEAAQSMSAMITFGLSGLGVPEWKATSIGQAEAGTLIKTVPEQRAQ